MKLLWARGVCLLAGGVVFLASLNAGLGFWVLKRLEKRSGAPLHGTFIPHLIRPTFTLKNPRIDWRGDFEIASGTLEVRYDPLFPFRGPKLRTWIEGQDLVVRLSGDLAQSQGLHELKIDRVQADFALSGKGDPEIFLLDIRSPQLEFRLAKDKSQFS